MKDYSNIQDHYQYTLIAKDHYSFIEIPLFTLAIPEKDFKAVWGRKAVTPRRDKSPGRLNLINGGINHV